MAKRAGQLVGILGLSPVFLVWFLNAALSGFRCHRGDFFEARAVFQNSADVLAQLPNERHGVLLDSLNRVTQHLRNIVRTFAP